MWKVCCSFVGLPAFCSASHICMRAFAGRCAGAVQCSGSRRASGTLWQVGSYLLLSFHNFSVAHLPLCIDILGKDFNHRMIDYGASWVYQLFWRRQITGLQRSACLSTLLLGLFMLWGFLCGECRVCLFRAFPGRHYWKVYTPESGQHSTVRRLPSPYLVIAGTAVHPFENATRCCVRHGVFLLFLGCAMLCLQGTSSFV